MPRGPATRHTVRSLVFRWARRRQAGFPERVRCVSMVDRDDDPLHAHLIHPAASADAAWWRHAVIYQIYPRSWADADGDGIGDLPGVTARLDYLKALGVDAVWFSPFYKSPQADAGYDVADYRDIDALFGTLADADAMVAQGPRARPQGDRRPRAQPHQRRARVVPGRAGRRPRQPRARPLHLPRRQGRRRRAAAQRLALRLRRRRLDPRHRGRRQPGQWYLHLFDTKQPDLNWDNPEIGDEFESILRFWLDRGIDGFRVDVAHGLIKEEGLPDYDVELHILDGEVKPGAPDAPDVGPGPRARRLPPLAQGAGRVRRAGPHPRRRGVGPPAGARGALRPPGRDAPGVQLRLPAEPVARRGPARGHRVLARRRRLRRRPEHLGAVQPRRGAARLAAGPAGRRAPPQRHQRRRPAARPRARPPAGARGDHADAGPARWRLPLPGRGAGPARLHRHARRVPPGPDLRAHRRQGDRARRVPGADARGRRTRRRSASVPPTRPGCPSRRSTASTPSTSRTGSTARPSSSTAPCCAPVASATSAPAACGSPTASATTSSPSSTPARATATPWSWPTSAPSRWRCPTARPSSSPPVR